MGGNWMVSSWGFTTGISRCDWEQAPEVNLGQTEPCVYHPLTVFDPEWGQFDPILDQSGVYSRSDKCFSASLTENMVQ